MILKQLYRYILGDWDNLSEKEIEDIPSFFQIFISNTHLQGAIKELGSTKLHEKLYGQEYKYSYYYVPNDNSVMQSFDIYETNYHYFNGVVKESLFKTYKSYYLLCNIVEMLSNENSSSLFLNAHENAYKLLVIFGGEDDIENALALFDAHCQNKNGQLSKDFFSKMLPYAFRHGEKKIDLFAWRKVIHEQGMDFASKLFYLAPELELHLGRAPSSISEVAKTAQTIVYAKHDLYPDFAAFCVFNYVLEELFNQCISEDKQQRMHASSFILKQLPNDQIFDFIRHRFKIGIDFDEVCSVFQLLKEEHQRIFLSEFKEYVLSHIEHIEDFCRFLTLGASFQVKQQFITIFTAEKINSYITTTFDLNDLLKALPPEYFYEFSTKIIKNKINEFVNSNYNYRDFLSNRLPRKEQVAYLKELFGSIKINRLAENHYYFIDQVTLISSEERLVYIMELFNKEKLKELLANNHSILESLLKCVEQHERLSLMIDAIGLQEVRSIVSTPRTQRAICALLPSEQAETFLNILPTQEEKSAKARILDTKVKIEAINFTLGVMGSGWGGQEIELDNHSRKLVPSTVAKQWDLIKDAQAGHLTYVAAWESVRKLALEVKPTTGSLTYFSRAIETKNYYKSFRKEPEQEQKLTL